MKKLIQYTCLLVLGSITACSLYVTMPLYGYQFVQGLDVGASAIPYYAYSNTALDVINAEFEKAEAKVTLKDTYQLGYKKPFSDIGPEGDTGQAFTDMATATEYLQNILKAKGAADADKYFLTMIDSARNYGFTLIAAVFRPDSEARVFDKYGASFEKTIACGELPFYEPYRYDCRGNPLDTVYEWAAVPNDCFEKQGHQAIFLTLTANKLLEKQPQPDYWDAERKWIVGDYQSVVIDQDYMVCQALGIETGYVEQKNLFQD